MKGREVVDGAGWKRDDGLVFTGRGAEQMTLVLSTGTHGTGVGRGPGAGNVDFRGGGRGLERVKGGSFWPKEVLFTRVP